MANIAAIRSVGISLENYFNNSYQEAVFPQDTTKPACTFTLTSIGGLEDTSISTENSVQVLLLLHRVGISPHLRNSGQFSSREKSALPVTLDLHYLFTFWASSAENEQLVLAWTLRELQMTPLLDLSVLSKEAGWTAEETVHLSPEDISSEEMTRIWDSLQPNYRLSVAYIARVVRIDPDEERLNSPVVASRSKISVPASSVE
jgi:hypothetical protein